MKHTQKGFAALPLIIIVLILLGAGTYFWSQKVAPAPAPAITTAPPGFTPPTTPPPSTPIPPIANPDPITGITAEEDAKIPPGPPGTVKVTQSNGIGTIQWEGTRDDRVGFYRVYRRGSHVNWVLIAEVSVRNEQNQGLHKYVDLLCKMPQCEYAVSAVKISGLEGPKNTEI